MSESITRTQEEFTAELTARFGADPMGWAFVCPSCGDVATGADMKAALAEHPRDGRTASDFLGQVCIGRILGALEGPRKEWEGRGCDWAAFGLFNGPDFAVLPNGTEVPHFRIAEPQRSPKES